MVQINVVVLLREETGLAIVAALDQVEGDGGERDAGTAGHEYLQERIYNHYKLNICGLSLFNDVVKIVLCPGRRIR